MNISWKIRKTICVQVLFAFAAMIAVPAGPALAYDTDGCSAPNVSEFDEYTLIYQLAIASDSDYADVQPPYSVNNAAIDRAFDRVAYCMELEVGGALQWVWVSMDAFTSNVREIGVPYEDLTFQTAVQNLNVYAGGATVTTGTAIPNGNLEFWDERSDPVGDQGLGGNNGVTDFDDAILGTEGSGGSMQVHNTDAQETIFAYNHWDSNGNVDDVGIGNAPSGNPDWMSAANAPTFTDRKDLYVLVREREVFRHAGDGEMEGLGDGGNAWQADVNDPLGVAVDSSGNVYFVDASQYRIRRVTPGGTISTYAGTGTSGYTAANQLATATMLEEPVGLAIDDNDNVYYTDKGASTRRVRMIDAVTGFVSDVAGNGGVEYQGDGGLATMSPLRNPVDVDFDSQGRVYILDQGTASGSNQGPRVRRVELDGTISTVAGNGDVGNPADGGLAINRSLNAPWGIHIDADDNIYIADSGNNNVRRVNEDTGRMFVIAGNVSGTAGTVDPDGEPAGTSGLFRPRGVTGDEFGNIYITDYRRNKIHRIDTLGTIRTIAGDGIEDFTGDGRDALRTSLAGPHDLVVVDSGQGVVFSDFLNDRTRLIATADANFAPSDISLSNSTVSVDAADNTVVGNLSTIDPDGGDSHSYDLVTGIGDTDNAAFRSGGSVLRARTPSAMAAGDYSVRIQTDDGNGGTFQEAFVVSVVTDDAVPPVITLLGDATVNIMTGSVYTDAGATASDDVDGDITANIVTVNNVDANTPGTYTVTYNVMDAGGNAAVEVVRTVNVANDATPPVITLLGSSPVSVLVGATYTDAGATATDNIDGDVTANIVVNSNVDTSTAGAYQVTYDVTDSDGNAATQVVRTVNVVNDTTAPVITLLGMTPVSVTVGNAYADAGATASDDVDGDITANIVTNSNVNTATAGTYQVTYDVTDAAGNAATQVVRTVNVTSAPPPPPPPPTPTSSGGGSFGILGLMFLMTMWIRRRIFVRS